jgi:hypothetical protein
MPGNNITFIEDLEDLDDVEPFPEQRIDHKYSKFIRQTHLPPLDESGMSSGMHSDMHSTNAPHGQGQNDPEYNVPHGPHGHGPHGHGPHGHGPHGPHGHIGRNSVTYGDSIVGNVNDAYRKTPDPFRNEKLVNSPSCLNFAEHVSLCPICKRLYNSDVSMYIIAMVVLAIIIILLLKRVMDL